MTHMLHGDGATFTPKRTYYIREENGRFYVYYLQLAPVETLFEVARSREEAEQAIKDHKAGKHSTQEAK